MPMGLERDALIFGVAVPISDVLFVQRAEGRVYLGRGHLGPRPLPEQFIAYF